METEEYQTKARAFMDVVEKAAEEVFDAEDLPIVVVGLQFGDMGKEDAPTSLPNCVLASNLPICLVGDALKDMQMEAARQHQAHHHADGDEPFMVTDPEDVPEEMREVARRLAEDLGVPEENIVFRSAVSTTDLSEDDLPDWLTGSDVAEAMTGGDIAAAGLGLSDEDVADVADIAQRIEDEQEAKDDE